MQDKGTDRFKLGDGDDSLSKTDTHIVADTRVKRLGRRVTLLAVLLPVLVAALLFLAYLDIIKRVGILESSGKTEVQTLSKDLDARLVDLSTKYTSMQENLQKKMAEVEKSIGALHAGIQKNEKTLAALSKAKMDKKELKSALSGTRRETGRLKADVKKLDAELRKSMDDLSAAVQAGMDKLSEDMKIVEAGIDQDLSSKINLETLHLEFFKEQKKNQRRIDAMDAKWQEKFIFLEKKINGLGKAAPAAQPSGAIIEQEIQ